MVPFASVGVKLARTGIRWHLALEVKERWRAIGVMCIFCTEVCEGRPFTGCQLAPEPRYETGRPRKHLPVHLASLAVTDGE